MILEKLDFNGNVLFEKEYSKRDANNLLALHAVYPQTNVTMFRVKEEAPKRGRKSKEDEKN